MIVPAVLWVCFLAFMAGWMWGRDYERTRLKNERTRLKKHAGANWQMHLADDGTLWGERTNGPGFIGPCRDFNEVMAAINAARDEREGRA